MQQQQHSQYVIMQWKLDFISVHSNAVSATAQQQMEVALVIGYRLGQRKEIRQEQQQQYSQYIMMVDVQ